MRPCTECTHHFANNIGHAFSSSSSSSSRAVASLHLPFSPSLPYQHANSSRIMSVAAAAHYFPDDPEALAAASFWAQSSNLIDTGYTHKSTAGDWLPRGFDEIDDDSRSDLGAPEVDEETWSAPPPTYHETIAASPSKHTCVLVSPTTELPAEAGTLGLSVNSSVIDVPDISTSSSSSSSPSSSSYPSSSSPFWSPIIGPKPPSLLSVALFGARRANARAQRRAERRAAHLDELHDAWARVGINTRERLARGGLDALPPFFEHPPRCGFQQMLDELPL
ncbi:hypothetical protein OC846_001481 [Tilletia horrida]|uniref:Uncharacterized protein n=1 Tax=Tilletia horrida TaxID=155126 RepID=A0AAN6JVU8_9BASI|nr:hypothetical protein OC845_006326 [Tilletia horrida]KAK0555929.1 hypothetical protein OC846_001481 [Tilletia horrida]